MNDEARISRLEDDIRDAFRKLGTVELAQGTHEATCAGRYKMIITLVLVSILINLPAAWPHVTAIMGMIK